MAYSRIAVVGAGIMGEAVITSLLRAGIDSKSISIIEKREQRRDEIVGRFGVQTEGISSCDAVFLLVKPQDLEMTLEQVKGELKRDALVVSFIAGKKLSFIEGFLGPGFRTIRVMPNTPMTLGKGFAVMSPGNLATNEDIAWLEKMLASSCEVITVPEEIQDAATALSGSGPAYFFAMVEAMADAGTKLGMSEEDSMKAAKQVLIGAAAMVEKSGLEPGTLRENVTSPNGTTFAALKTFAEKDFSEVVYLAMKAARDRSIELGK